MKLLNKGVRSSLIAGFLIISAHRLPAPISEESTPTTPPEESAKSKTKPLPKPKPKSEASESATNSVRQQRSSKQSRFAGTWVGTMPEVPWGNVATELVVDHIETTMIWQESGNRKGLAKAQLIADTLQASFPGWAHPVWSITPEPDGATARVRLQAFMNDQTAVFRRTAIESSSAKTTR